jgi:predicted GNAT family acetyltransferase
VPVRSKKQWKWMFASGQPFAERWADETPGGRVTRFRRLPERAPSTKADLPDAPPWAVKQTASERAMFANMGSSGGGGGGGGGGGKPTGGQGGLWKRGADGKRTPQAGVQTPKPAQASGSKPAESVKPDKPVPSITSTTQPGRFGPRTVYSVDGIADSEMQVMVRNDGHRSVATFYLPPDARGQGTGQRMVLNALRDGELAYESGNGVSDAYRRVQTRLIEKGLVQIRRDEFDVQLMQLTDAGHGAATKAEPAAASGAPRKKMTPAEVARHAALVRWKKKNPLMARQMAIREKRKAKGAGGGAKPAAEAPAAAPPANGGERTKFLADLGLDANTAEALSEYLGGLADGEEMALNAQAAEALQALGLATMREGDGPNRGIDLTAAGKKLQAAVAKGDSAAAAALVKQAKPKGEAGAAAPGKEEKPKGGGGGGGGGGKEEKKPEADKDAAKEQERAARAAETGGKVGLQPEAVDDLRAAAESGGVQNEKLIALGLVGEDGTTTDQGRRALTALERGDVRGYRAALQDVEAARGRAKAKADKDAARTSEREARDAERETARAAREQERADRDAAREKAKRDKEDQELSDMADDFRRGRRGLSFEQQRRLIRAGRARMNGEKFELKRLALELDLLELDV